MDTIKKEPIHSSHYLKKQSDPRVKYDTEFIDLQKKLGVKFEQQAKEFISNMSQLRKECKKNFEEKRDKIALINKDRISKQEKQNKLVYDRICSVRKEFREFLDKRQEYLEKTKKIILGKKDWSLASDHYQEYLNHIESKKAEIHEMRKAFDWGELRSREVKYVQERNERQKDREEKCVVKNEKFGYFQNQKEFEYVKNVDREIKAKFENASLMSKKRKMYADLIKERFRPVKSEVNIGRSLIMQQEMQKSVINIKNRREKGLLNKSQSKDYLSFSKQIGKQTKEARELKSYMSASLPSLNKNIGTDPILLNPKNYLQESKKFTGPILEKKREALTKSIFLLKPAIKNLETSDKHKLEAELKHMDREAVWKQQKIGLVTKPRTEKLIEEQEADTVLIKAMVAKCLFNDHNMQPDLKNSLQAVGGVYPNQSSSMKLKDDFAWRKRRYKVTNKAMDKLIGQEKDTNQDQKQDKIKSEVVKNKDAVPSHLNNIEDKKMKLEKDNTTKKVENGQEKKPGDKAVEKEKDQENNKNISGDKDKDSKPIIKGPEDF